MKKIIKKIIGILILVCLFLLWFISQVIVYGFTTTIVTILIILFIFTMMALAIYLVFGD